MKSPTATRRRNARGFTLLVGLGVVTLVSLAVLLSYGVVSREAETQGDGRRRKEAFFAAEAGLAEGREAMRLRLAAEGNLDTYNQVIPDLGAPVNEPGLGGGGTPWYEVLPGPAATGGWNQLRLTTEDMAPTELASAGGTPYAEYPTQDNVRYRVFVRDDLDDANPSSDTNGQVWLISVGEVMTEGGRPTRSIVQALIINENASAASGPGCVNRGCGPDNTYNNTQDTQAPDTTNVRTL
ncbi:pilus assembly PilX N-terminal domain-containing protein [Pyxidicoccus xibeiensis]|uniref:pilus assembly PilX N-terminal domain-containing protein n=1 Tax=Pyxidicoccus xibeiensis TaxID=2906759 RepID=UPI0020A7B657|nr:pilus assembly PilX N-terminal domain-containing protein [Pyxidicoccus xibeiensis]MCP3136543.1 pilus assembly PilX N-terminal domain-containing protein [Pyxidicoccus xibeiensis]